MSGKDGQLCHRYDLTDEEEVSSSLPHPVSTSDGSWEVYVPYGRPYGLFEQHPHEWFEWVSPSLRGHDGSYEETADWPRRSIYAMGQELAESEESFPMRSPTKRKESPRRPSVMQKMKGWLSRGASS